jgi:cyclopropane fatty-acyl-phospholipid synthase-like methyltransferase
MHRRIFAFFAALPSWAQGAILHRIFERKYRTPDPFGICSDHESGSYQQRKLQVTAQQVPVGSYRRILDVGCGEGLMVSLLADDHPMAQIVGVDISEGAIRRGRELVGDNDRIELHAMDILRRTPTGQFDLIVCAEVLYYLGPEQRGRQLAARLRALLSPSGVLVLQHPWPESEELHRDFDQEPGLRTLDTLVDRDPHRPFAVTRCQRAAVHQ